MKNDLTPSLLAMAVLGALILALACNAGMWYLANHMAWWTYAAAATGFTLGWGFIKGIVKAVRK